MDRISGLSDDVLVKILLFVPTKVAVSTSVLSKRWKYLWMWLPKLEFRKRCLLDPECERLQSFLDRNLPLHRAPVIETFRLDMLRSGLKPESISMWVSTVLSHRLRELDIRRGSDLAKPVILPSDLYTSKSLVVLKLAGLILLDVPRLVSLPSLKTLKLRSLRCFNDDETLQRLLSNCPILEDLVLVLSDGDASGKLTVVVPSLQRLTLYLSCREIEGYVIETPSLKYFKLTDYCRDGGHYCLIENTPYLIEAYLDVNRSDIKSVIGSITSVKRLTISSQAMILDESFVFNQLEHLELCLSTLVFPDQLVRLLRASPNLQGLHLSFIKYRHIFEFIWNQPTTVPECLLSSLQRLSWSEYTGEPKEREIVVYILKHALHLKTATVKSSESSAVPKSEMLKELSLSYRASAACQLMFE